MSIFQTEIEKPKESPFLNCKLGREKYANVLSDIVKSYSDGFVLAIDNKWGEGKTTFVEMWKVKLENDGFKTVYFNAWENDFESNPFVALVSEFKIILGGDTTKTFKELMKKGTQVSKALLPALAKTLFKKHFGEDIGEIGEGGVEGVMEVFEEEIKDYADKKKSIKDFKVQLESYIEENSPEKPVIIIIDELDRCRPDYAVEVLENIKHLFSVKKIVFVLSIDKAQLGHAICGYYGSEKLDSSEYLRRFIDIEYSIPQPDTSAFVKYLYSKYNFESYFNNRPNADVLRREKEMFLDVVEFLFKLHELTLRQQERIFTHLRITLNTFAPNNYVLPELYVYLTLLKMFDGDTYYSIMNRKFTNNELLQANANFIKSKNSIPQDKINLSIHIEAMLVVMYNNFLEYDSGKKIELGRRQNIMSTSLPQSKMDSSSEQEKFKNRIEVIRDNFDFGDVKIEYLFKKIELTEPFIKK